MSTVLVTDAARGAAVACIRSLAAAGHRVLAADSATLGPGRWSRHVDGRFTYPEPNRAPEGAGRALARVIADHGVDVVVPVTDAVIAALETVGSALPAATKVAVAGQDQLAVVCRKDATLKLAGSLDVPVPRTESVTSVAGALDAADRLGWPLVVKPGTSTVPTGTGELTKLVVGYARDRDQLAALVGPLEGLCTILLQEVCSGDGVGVEVLAHEGRILAAFQHRRLREVPLSGGASSLRESVPLDQELFAHTEALMAALDWTGVAMVEFKCGDRGPRLMEINGRLWGSLPLAVKAGMDFPARLVALLVDGPPPAGPPAVDYRIGVRSRNVRLEALWAAAVLTGRAKGGLSPLPPRREGLRTALGLLSPRDGYDILSWRDPLPGVAELVQLAGKARSVGAA